MLMKVREKLINNMRFGAVSRWVALAVFTVIGLLALIAADNSTRLEQRQLQKSRMERITRRIETRLTSEIQIPLNSVVNMQAFMLAYPALPDYKTFDQFAAHILRYNPAIHGFAYVDAQRVIQHFYPMVGNEKAIGLDLTTRPAAKYVERAIRQKTMTISPPTVTVQGPLAIIARIPLYRDDRLLGLVQGVIDIDKALQLATEDLDDDVHINIQDTNGKLFWGPQHKASQVRQIVLPVGNNHWLASIWLDSSTSRNETTIRLFIWVIGGALLASLLYIINRISTDRTSLSIAVRHKTAQLTASESRWHTMLEQVHLIGVGLDRNGLVNYVNPFFCKISGFDKNEIIGKDWFKTFLLVETRQELSNVFEKLRGGEMVENYFNPIRTKSGEERLISWFNARLLDEYGNFDGTFSIGEDITPRHELEKRLDYLAFHDTLTGLPNRTLFLDRLSHAVMRAQRDNTLLALLIIDLDQFKNINDGLGHFAGDLLLKAAAERFKRATRSADTVARLGGDEFTILLENIRHIDAVVEITEKILKEFTIPFEIEKNKLYITASIGIVMYPLADDAIEDLMRAADTAMYHAKAAGRNCYQFYEASMAAIAHNRLNVANNLHDALMNNEFSVVFQPIVDLSSQTMIGYETLLRWEDSELGWVSPAEFIPVAESTGIIVNIGYWVIREACRSYNLLQTRTNEEICISINVSAYQFQDDKFIENFREILFEENIPPNRLIVELTESQMMEETQITLQVLHALRDMGCRTSIDDFGTGYSSLSYLRSFPIDLLKIDRSFIADMTSDDNSIALLKAILMIASSLDIDVIAEGVETEKQISILKGMGIKMAQGYLVGRPARLENLLN